MQFRNRRRILESIVVGCLINSLISPIILQAETTTSSDITQESSNDPLIQELEDKVSTPSDSAIQDPIVIEPPISDPENGESEIKRSSVLLNITVASTPINVTLPTKIEMEFNGSDPSAIFPQNLSIINNNQSGSVYVSNVRASMKDFSWKLVDETQESYFKTLPMDSKQIYLGFSEDDITYQSLSSEIDTQMEIRYAGSENAQNFYLRGMTGGSKSDLKTNLVDLILTLRYIARVPGLYDENKQLMKSWDQMIKDGDVTVSGTIITGSNKDKIVGQLVIPEGITAIGGMGFYQCAQLTKVTFPNSLITIGSFSFQSCVGLTSISIPNSVTTIEGSAFSFCNNLESVKLSSSLTLIGAYAFESCTKIKSIYIPESVTTIGANAFFDVLSITYDGPAEGMPWGARNVNETLVKENGFVFSRRTNTILEYTGTDSTVTIPSKISGVPVKTIGAHAFEKNQTLTHVVFEEGITIIGMQAFYQCPRLTSIDFPNSLTSIDMFAFQSCTKLKSVILPESLITLGQSAFSFCVDVETIQLSSALTTIGAYAFENCVKVPNVLIPDSVTSIGASAFANVRSITYHGSAGGAPWGANKIN